MGGTGLAAFDEQLMVERYELCVERIREIIREDLLAEPLLSYFCKTSEYILMLAKILDRSLEGGTDGLTEADLAAENQRIYEDILPDNYATSYANPDYIVNELANAGIDQAEAIAKYLCFVYTEVRGLIPASYEGDIQIFTTYIELFVEIYTMFAMAHEDGGYPKPESIADVIYWFESDNCDLVVPKRVRSIVDASCSFATDIIMNSDLNNTRYLYLFGEYISDDELTTSRFLASLSEEEIKSMADTFTEGYRIGFVKAGKPIDKKRTVNVRYSLGFERITRAAIENFRAMGLEPTIYRAATLSLDKYSTVKVGYVGANPNRQYDFDHKDDEALYMNADFVTRKSEVLREAYESLKELACGHAGPACQEVFGEDIFEPVSKKTAVIHTDKTRALSVDYRNKSSRIVNEYIRGEERSFTIIAYPTPSIGKDYEDIFRQTVRLNTLDYKTYEHIQQLMIDALDGAEYVLVKGTNGNKTDLRIQLYTLTDASRQTKFENCVADVNIPVGEVFTSPVLTGTEGVLHVTSVYLNELLYKDFTLNIRDGMITECSCANFEDDADNQKYLRDNFLYGHKSLPMGEFAIGTNTVAYKMARKYGIEAKLPILIGEKTGPHFAFGDTCYSREEDVKVYNPDGKEIVARDNEVSIMRKTDPQKAYFQCHTDVTIPYDELGSIVAIGPGGQTVIFDNGQFTIPGCEELNIPLKE